MKTRIAIQRLRISELQFNEFLELASKARDIQHSLTA
jgi:hypothetical protein